jgi:hypothetical protein
MARATGKQAVLLIHGVGFQRPMRTLRGFVEAVWTTDSSLRRPNVPSQVWSKPDTISDSFELRRLTTAQNTHGVRTDFFEFYWAHLLEGTTLQQVVLWLRSLLWRNPLRIPRPLLFAWIVVWLALLWIAALAINLALPDEDRFWHFSPWWSASISVLLLPGLVWLLREFVGDAAVYLDSAPANIQSRHEIRSAGVRLLEVLHRRGYERIVIVGHSLGSVIGYDILRYAWAEMHDRFVGDAPQSIEALQAAESLATRSSQWTSDEQNQWRQLQRRYLNELQTAGHVWRVTDFITLGSPLTYASYLMALNRADYERQIQERELATDPPVLERHVEHHVEDWRFSYDKTFTLESGRTLTRRVPHHAAVFAPVVWTNLYFPCIGVFRGDIAAGPVGAELGSGVRDVKLHNDIRGGWLLHTHYWLPVREPPPNHVEELRRALNLNWGGAANSIEPGAKGPAFITTEE